MNGTLNYMLIRVSRLVESTILAGMESFPIYTVSKCAASVNRRLNRINLAINSAQSDSIKQSSQYRIQKIKAQIFTYFIRHFISCATQISISIISLPDVPYINNTHRKISLWHLETKLRGASKQ